MMRAAFLDRLTPEQREVKKNLRGAKIAEHLKPVVLVVNKWDLPEKDEKTMGFFIEEELGQDAVRITRADIEQVYQALQSASENNHLTAFENCAAGGSNGGPANGSGGPANGSGAGGPANGSGSGGNGTGSGNGGVGSGNGRAGNGNGRGRNR